ncbi:MAG: hypothetical protein DMG57_29045 [Acidobacteria bacterium]|nr:MAG: hypothetical protein DMG57_29045 [Acidobacteriota bacterium]
MHATGGYLNLAFFTKYVGDFPVGPSAAAEFLDKFSVQLQSRAWRFVRQGVQDVTEFGVHDRVPKPAFTVPRHTIQSLDVSRSQTISWTIV